MDHNISGKRDTFGIVGTLVVVTFLICSGLLALWWPRLQGARWAARVTESRNNLKYQALGLYTYHDVYDVFPAGGTLSHDGRPYHSWQTVILPCIDGAPFYDEIDFDYAWSDPVNSPVFKLTIPIYLNPAISESRSVDGYGMSHYAGNVRVLRVNENIRISEISDGTSYTLMAGEVAAEFKAWGDPTNLRDPATGLGVADDQFGTGFRPGALFMLADGSVRFISETIHPDVLHAISTPNGGETVEDF